MNLKNIGNIRPQRYRSYFFQVSRFGSSWFSTFEYPLHYQISDCYYSCFWHVPVTSLWMFLQVLMVIIFLFQILNCSSSCFELFRCIYNRRSYNTFVNIWFQVCSLFDSMLPIYVFHSIFLHVHTHNLPLTSIMF